MIKRRKNIESFAAAADSTQKPSLNTQAKQAKRDYKSINLSFNAYEYEQLDAAAKKVGRSKLSFIRYAVSELARRELDN